MRSRKKFENKSEIEFTPGAVIRSPGSTLNTKTGSWRSERPVLDLAKCTKCGLCWTFCPDAAIRKNKKGEFEINYDYCKGCGICASVCPVKAISMKKEEK
ncbi:MAG: pyruvate synthase subunit PorD [Candidatus Woesearchaeota archaeon]